MNRLRVGVVGAGHLGRIHARLLNEMEDIHVAAIVDSRPNAAQEVASTCDAQACLGLDELPKLDAAVVATPTTTHHDVGLELINRGLHLLIEKPLASSSIAAQSLAMAARRAGRVVQVGHVERFNPAWQALSSVISNPKYIEARRTSGFSFRSTDVGVVMDLMIHDLDLILQLANSEVTKVTALGTAVLGVHEDMAQVRLEFASGCVANLTSSRTATQAERTMSVYSADAYGKVDFQERTAEVIRPRADVRDGSFDLHATTPAEQQFIRENLFQTVLQREPLMVVPGANPLHDEQRDFLDAIREQRAPQVTIEQGCDAVAVAERILLSMEEHSWNGTASGPKGPRTVFAPATISLPLPPEHDAEPRRKAG